MSAGVRSTRRVVDIAAAAGVHRAATWRLARRHGIPLVWEPGRDALGRRRRVLAACAGDAERLEALHRARRERWPEPPREVRRQAPERVPARSAASAAAIAIMASDARAMAAWDRGTFGVRVVRWR